MGVVDELAEDGQGAEAVHRFVREFERTRRARQAVLTARKIVNPVTLQESVDIADLWVDTALQLSPSDLRRMKHLATAQDRRWARIRAH